LRFRVQGVGCVLHSVMMLPTASELSSSGFRVWGLRCRVQGVWCVPHSVMILPTARKLSSSGFRVQGLGFEV